MKSRFSFQFLETSTEVLRAVAHPIRLSILDLLVDKQEGMNVSAIQETLDIEQAVASHHLRIMKDKGILMARREGKQTFYVLREQACTQLIHTLESMERASWHAHAA